jgi:hypothetical protein
LLTKPEPTILTHQGNQDPLAAAAAAAAANKLSDIDQYFLLFTLLYHHPFELAS